jgi:Uri superfamily endonuclease
VNRELSGDYKLDQAKLPSEAGTYCLLLRLPQDHKITVGKLGEFDFPAGEYIYTSSALGSGGLRARINRHLRHDKNPHWHIDWLKAEAEAEGGWFVTSELRTECIWAQSLIQIPGVSIPVLGFGSSDCQLHSNCTAHLVFSRRGFNFKVVGKNLASAVGCCNQVYNF